MNDLISRQAAIEAIERLILPQTKGETAAEEINRVAWRCAINCAEEMIGHLPPVEAEPVKRGKWVHEIRNTIDSLHTYQQFRCSICGMTYITNTPYCPNCGARMENNH